jgi:hypothetical protein
MLHLPDTAFLPMAAQVSAQKKLKERWLQTELGQKIQEEAGPSLSPPYACLCICMMMDCDGFCMMDDDRC